MEFVHINNAVMHAILPKIGSDSAMRRLKSFQLLMIDELSDTRSDMYCINPEWVASIVTYWIAGIRLAIVTATSAMCAVRYILARIVL